MPDYDYLIVGGGMAGASAAKAIHEVDPEGTIAIISTEKHNPYNRPPLTKKLWQGKPESIIWRKLPEENLTLILDCRVSAIDPQNKLLRDQHGRAYGYNKLLLATGGTPRRLPFDNGETLYYRTFDDYKKVREWTGHGAKFGVIGGGFIGAEIAQALSSNGEQVVMAFPEHSIGERIYPADLSRFLSDHYREKGVDLRPETGIESIHRRQDGFVMVSKDGLEIEVQHIIAGIGIQPNTELAQEAGIALNEPKSGGGIRVDENLRTNLPDIYAAGDVAFFHNTVLDKDMRVEHADNAETMGRAAGLNMAGKPTRYDHQPFFYSDMFDLGYEAVGELDSRMETFADWKEPFREGVVYYLRDGAVRGVLLWNTWDQVDAARALIASGKQYTNEELKGKIGG